MCSQVACKVWCNFSSALGGTSALVRWRSSPLFPVLPGFTKTYLIFSLKFSYIWYSWTHSLIWKEYIFTYSPRALHWSDRSFSDIFLLLQIFKDYLWGSILWAPESGAYSKYSKILLDPFQVHRLWWWMAGHEETVNNQVFSFQKNQRVFVGEYSKYSKIHPSSPTGWSWRRGCE